jgi:hypothetical protein
MNLLELKNRIELVEIVQGMAEHLLYNDNIGKVTAPNGNTVLLKDLLAACESILTGSDIDEEYIIEVSNLRETLAKEY